MKVEMSVPEVVSLFKEIQATAAIPQLGYLINREGEKTKEKWGWRGFTGDKRGSRGVGVFSQRKNSMKWQDVSQVLTGEESCKGPQERSERRRKSVILLYRAMEQGWQSISSSGVIRRRDRSGSGGIGVEA